MGAARRKHLSRPMPTRSRSCRRHPRSCSCERHTSGLKRAGWKGRTTCCLSGFPPRIQGARPLNERHDTRSSSDCEQNRLNSVLPVQINFCPSTRFSTITTMAPFTRFAGINKHLSESEHLRSVQAHLHGKMQTRSNPVRGNTQTQSHWELQAVPHTVV